MEDFTIRTDLILANTPHLHRHLLMLARKAQLTGKSRENQAGWLSVALETWLTDYCERHSKDGSLEREMLLMACNNVDYDELASRWLAKAEEIAA